MKNIAFSFIRQVSGLDLNYTQIKSRLESLQSTFEKCFSIIYFNTLLLSFAVLIKNFEDARPVVRWFNAQQKVGGGYGSTQVTQNFLSIKIS